MWLPVFVALTVLNPLFNPRGEHVLFTIFGRPYTGEALAYGGVIAGVFVVMMLWFGCYNRVMTSDKFMCLFGNWAPSLSLLLVMVFRLVPRFFRQTRQLIGARRSVGKGTGKGYRDKVAAGNSVLTMGCLVARTEWLEDNSELVPGILEEYAASIDYANSNPEEAAALIEQYGIVPKAAVAQAAIPQANMVCVTGEDMKGIADYYQVLFDADPTSIGGAIPGEDFYYIP